MTARCCNKFRMKEILSKRTSIASFLAAAGSAANDDGHRAMHVSWTADHNHRTALLPGFAHQALDPPLFTDEPHDLNAADFQQETFEVAEVGS